MRQRGVNDILYTEEWANKMKLVIDGHFLASVLRRVYDLPHCYLCDKI
jgi:hypothetical protein